MAHQESIEAGGREMITKAGLAEFVIHVTPVYQWFETCLHPEGTR